MNKSILILTVLIAGSLVAQAAEKKKGKKAAPQPHATGYTDTPYIPGQKWRVHDDARPRPPVVKPGAKFSDLAPPPADAVVLFDGKDLSKWEGKGGGEAQW
jgi:hypothetical protein